ncbi:MAG: glycosyltransferase [Chitinophagaceae bacterium]|nr:glycosyltransferase [Chitinophagaceae bacterium]
MGKKLHIISLDIPYPPDYGGMIDVYYKIKALAAAEVEITLHCFQYGKRQPADELLQYCRKVHYYPRKTGVAGLHATLPYIISSRRDKTLLQNLKQDDAAILFEGLHCTFLFNEASLNNRVKILRAHNIESDYYRELAKNSRSFLKKIYYYLEAGRLLQYENNLRNLTQILAISQADEKALRKKYNDAAVLYIPAFHAIEKVTSLTGTGTYCLYHGNLSVAENIQSVLFLAQQIFSELNTPLIIAGKNPAPEIVALASDQIRIISNPDENEMQTLIKQAQIHVLPSFQQTGIKLKLLHALFAGRHCISNDLTMEQPLPEFIHYAEDVNTFRAHVSRLINQAFTQQDIDRRIELLTHFKNENSAQKIVALLPEK